MATVIAVAPARSWAANSDGAIVGHQHHLPSAVRPGHAGQEPGHRLVHLGQQPLLGAALVGVRVEPADAHRVDPARCALLDAAGHHPELRGERATAGPPVTGPPVAGAAVAGAAVAGLAVVDRGAERVHRPVQVAVTWSGLTSQPKCAGTRQRVGAGTYTLYAVLSGKTGTAKQFTIS